ncbi:hypothetical protein V5O48_002138 [Marasmius crinis-equi]|uniref:ferric-chelate reductase (NADPH) n=1 Tax=Marasmius crinis-equi TaxID=585013 RepID=A0ABR3FX44_9AGAR
MSPYYAAMGTLAGRAAVAASNGTSAGAGSSASTNASGASASGAKAAAGGKGPKVDSELLMYHISLFILALLAVVVVVRLPRAIGRFSRAAEWTKGHVFGSKSFSNNTVRRVQWTHDSGPYTGGDYSSDSSHDMYGKEAQLQRVDNKGIPIATSYPPHFASTPAAFRPITTLLHTRVHPGVSISHLVVMAIYLAILVYPSFYKTNAFTDPKRFGWIAVAQYPFVYAFGTKNNMIGMVLAVGYEKINFIHRFAGRLAILAANVHGIGYLYKFTAAGTFQESIAKPANYWGLIALICMDCLFFFSTAFWRQKAYNIFISTHVSSLILLFPATIYHKETTMYWVFATVGIYGLDAVICRTIKTRIATASILPLPELGVTRVEVPWINSGWRAGQHVRVRVFSSGMGLFGWSEVHPFTIASTTGGPDGLVLMCKKAGSWTNKLYNIAMESKGLSPDGQGRVKMMIEGPYGGPGHRVFSSFSAAVFIAGGSGITFSLSAVQELVRQDLAGQSRIKLIHLVWTVQDPSALVPLLPQFQALVQESIFTPIRISVFYTRAPTGKFPFSDDFFARSPYISLSPGRPKMEVFVESAVDNTLALASRSGEQEPNCGVIVGVCGPVALADGVFRSVGRVDRFKRDKVGGIEVHEETFGW